MKKSLVALAALAVAGVASAQSSVTLFGIVDASVSHVTNKSDLYVANPLAPANIFLPNSLKASKTGLNHSAYNSSRLGFRGVEDLGGGLAASFWLEAPITNDDGATGVSTFSRRSTISLSGNFGEVRLGRDYKPTFWNFTVFDPFGTNGAGTALIQRAAGGIENSNVRASNTIGYFLPKNLGGFYGQVQYGFHEQAKYDNSLQGSLNDNSRGGQYWGGRFGYANGPLDVAVAYGEQTNTSSWIGGTDRTAKNLNVGASYDLGVVKLFGQYANLKGKTDFNGLISEPTFNPANKLEGYLFGVTAPIGAGLIRASYGHVKTKVDINPAVYLANPFFQDVNPKADQLALGYVHNLSKRTALYATVAYIKNKNGAAYSTGAGNINVDPVVSYTAANGATGVYRPKTSLGYDFGVRHSF
ncbi:MAG: porin [Alcaligenaceae bacterium]|nr:MAG: porin [Alcaligenaceae bacterium]